MCIAPLTHCLLRSNLINSRLLLLDEDCVESYGTLHKVPLLDEYVRLAHGVGVCIGSKDSVTLPTYHDAVLPASNFVPSVAVFRSMCLGATGDSPPTDFGAFPVCLCCYVALLDCLYMPYNSIYYCVYIILDNGVKSNRFD